ncbi:hypothetical protein ACFQ3P_24615 [Paraburkholderia sabiae]|jgi:hypothetical protein|uniref:Uncharacterized protein n=1 Tax=Paraburkholderia sabiae TaxID=273251 RepID=A0ABU9QPD1_9BURK|nr:hypothetical protein [Paraburkholderia sabiae]WJZ76305.1 hypothetical protein QEN71_11010 [Paraburkholderia sabiae]CAD6550846.1 hypothetical protein LMG24235_04877 [Paraburkholderia sabiae]
MSNARSTQGAVYLEGETQVTLLTLIVALHLLVYAETRWWLTASQAVDAMRRWHMTDASALDVMRRVTLSSRALPLAMRLVECHASLRDSAGLQAAFTDQLQIDKDADQYRIIRRACEMALLRM